MSDYMRSKDGKTVHRWSCSKAVNGVDWNYAEGMDDHQIMIEIHVHPWLKACRVCRPDSALAAQSSPSPERSQP